jgi:ribonucleoside-diphosphate reductase alpha chain
MVNRVTQTLARQETTFAGVQAGTRFAESFRTALDNKDIIMSTPVMTNAGRYADRPLTACTVPTTDFDPASSARLREEVISLHEQGMGTGFNLDETDDPVASLRFLNEVAVESADSGREDRPVGNMAVLSVRHPMIYEFVNAKVDAPTSGTDWKFNISVNIDDAFMEAVGEDWNVTLWGGRPVDARHLFDEICAAAASCADPGHVFLDRMNSRNPLPGMGTYTTTAPCAEVGLIAGETCQFGYINIGKFVSSDMAGCPLVDFPRLERTTQLMVRALDNCLEISQARLADTPAQYVLAQKRKIGVGLCGLADALSIVGLPYDSDAARTLMEDVLSFINFTSKEASIRLAEQRGAFGAMKIIVIGNRHRESPGHIERLYGRLESNTVSADEWCRLSRYVASTGMLRHVSTIALPPTGRSALIIDASTGIEPHFDTFSASDEVLTSLLRIVRLKYGESIHADPARHSQPVREILASASDIDVSGHIGMAAALQCYTDEAISKTINLPAGSTAGDVRKVYCAGYQAQMSGVTVYVDGTHTVQPKKLRAKEEVS